MTLKALWIFTKKCTAKSSSFLVLSSKKFDKYEYLTDEDTSASDQRRMIGMIFH